MLQFKPEGIFCKPGGFYIDPWRPVESAVITHGHSDHARTGMGRYLCHIHSVPILKARLGPDITVEGIEYNNPIHINGVKVSLHPAGHIIGSAQIRMEYKGEVAVVSGDYKIQDDGLSTPFEPVRCNQFVSESTFGLPIYNWLPVEKQYEQLRNWCIENQALGKTSVFVAYSLGKAQRIMKSLEGIAELNVHYSISKLNKAYETAGIELPAWSELDLRTDTRHLDKQIVIVPPSLLDSNLIKKIPNMANALCSGWMQVRGARRWRSVDAGFPISDHADWPGLLQAIRETGAEKVFITHGQTAVFSKYLRELGLDAQEVKTEFGTEDEAGEIPNDEILKEENQSTETE